MTKSDKYFYVKWEDSQRKKYTVGVLARIDGVYYLKCDTRRENDKENKKSAYNNGFNGIPSFDPNRLYISRNKVFDFFEQRIPKKEKEDNNYDDCEELKKNSGISLIDSFTVEEIPQEEEEKWKELLTKMAENEQQKNR